MLKVVFSFVVLFVFGIAFAKIGPRSPASVLGISEVNVQGENTWIRIDGDSAQALYDAMTSVTPKNNQGEAGPKVFFKTGKSYQCYMNTEAKLPDYGCVMTAKDPKTGAIK
ncbi:MAG: hypothetical protein V4736_00400 [Bdellovibrionota bacterium]